MSGDLGSMMKRILNSPLAHRSSRVESMSDEARKHTAYLMVHRVLSIMLDEEALALVESKAIQLNIQLVNQTMPFLLSDDPASWNEAVLEVGENDDGEYAMNILVHARAACAEVVDVLGLSDEQESRWGRELPHEAMLDLHDGIYWMCLPMMLVVIGSANISDDGEGVEMLKRVFQSGELLDEVRHYSFTGMRLMDAAMQSVEEAVDRRNGIG